MNGIRALGRGEAGAPARAARAGADASAVGDAAVVCRACDARVTERRARATVNGTHLHRFMNPAGCLFQLGCYAQAPGCEVVGEPSDEYPWFVGHAWRYALCAACGVHLGWRFEAGPATFFGLRLDRVRDYFSDSSPAA